MCLTSLLQLCGESSLVLFANEMRTAFDEFTYLARRLPSGRSVAFQVSAVVCGMGG